MEPIPPKKYGKWTEADMERAIASFCSGDMGINAACRTYGVSKPTLKRRIQGKNLFATGSKKVFGRSQDLPPSIEQQLVDHVQNLQRMSFELNRNDIKKLAFEIAECNGLRHRFNREKRMAGNKWYYSFLSRHTELSLTDPEGASMAMTAGLTNDRVKTLGPDEAAKCRPSNFSVEVWRLMESARKNDSEGDRSDESSQENLEGSASLQAILDKLMPFTPEVQVDEIKVEADSDEYNTEGETSQYQVFRKKSEAARNKRSRISIEDKPMDLAEQKSQAVDCVVRQFHNEEAGPSLVLKNRTDHEDNTQRALWIFDAAQREHELKVRMLNVELERAELQKQTAINELKTSEIKRQLIESQAAEYYSQVRMVGERGSGAGKGGGAGGSIRDAGGSFGKMEAANEDQYFYNQQKEQLQKLKEDLHDEISFHEEQIKRHQEAINRHKQRITEIPQKE